MVVVRSRVERELWRCGNSLTLVAGRRMHVRPSLSGGGRQSQDNGRRRVVLAYL
jgi:hypothetical protein